MTVVENDLLQGCESYKDAFLILENNLNNLSTMLNILLNEERELTKTEAAFLKMLLPICLTQLKVVRNLSKIMKEAMVSSMKELKYEDTSKSHRNSLLSVQTQKDE